MSDTTNTVTFDESRAMRYTPNREPKLARVMEVPAGQETVIEPEWGGEQRFVGTWVAVLDPDTGAVKYGSAYQEWINTNVPSSELPDVPTEQNVWYKNTPVDAYAADTEGVLVTELADGTVETTKPVHPGDYLVRQQDGEVMCVSADKFPRLYNVNSAKPLS